MGFWLFGLLIIPKLFMGSEGNLGAIGDLSSIQDLSDTMGSTAYFFCPCTSCILLDIFQQIFAFSKSEQQRLATAYGGVVLSMSAHEG